MNVAIAKNNRLQYIDNLKGFAIVLVVIGHVIQCMYAPGTYQDNVLFRYIYSFHMPLFMMLSGMTLNIHKRIPMENLPKFIGRRFLQLVVPFVVWGLITTNTSSVVPFYKIFVQPDLSLWFLWTLFWIYTTCICGLSIQQKFFKGHPLLSVFSGYILLTIVRLIVHGKYGIGMISSYYLYYSIGIVLGGGIKDRVKSLKYKDVILIMMLLAFAVLGYYWYRMPPIISQKALHFGVACLGSFTCILFFARMDEILNFKIFNKLGTMTLGIYAIHQSLIWGLNKLLPIGVRNLNKTLVGFMVSLITVLLLTLTIRYTLRLSKVTSLLFLGENRFRE